MSYKIAIASSDGTQIDETFGTAKGFIIYEVTDGVYKRLEERHFHEEVTDKEPEDGMSGSCGTDGDCGGGNGCGGAGSGCGTGAGYGCNGAGNVSEKVEMVSDCRCIVCMKIGFHVQKQLERKAISAFDVSCSVEEALEKISHYFMRIDNHESLRMQK